MKYIIHILSLIIVLLAPANLSVAYKNVRFVAEFGGKGEALGKFSEKTRIAFDKDNNMYILDIDNLRVQKLDPDGRPIMEIAPQDALFMRPVSIAVDGKLNIYVVDWKPVHIEGTDSPKVFNYGPCIHKFSSDGKYVATFTLEDLTKKKADIEKAVPAIDTEGNFALMIRPEKPDRQLYISADSEGNLYVLDQDRIYKLNPSGDVMVVFAEPGGGPGQLDNPTGITVDGKGNIYIADTGNHRVLKFDPDGKFLLSFGKEGETDGKLFGTLYIVSASDGTILVADSAEYKKIFKIPQRRKLINSTVLVTGQDDLLIPRERELETVIRRFQRFDENGKFLEKVLYRIDKTDPELRDLEFKAIAPDGSLYLIDKDRLVIRKYLIESPFQWSAVEKTFTYRYLHNRGKIQLDDFYDLNTYYDFYERERYTQMIATFKLNYDMTESFSVSLASSLMRLDGKIIDEYPGEREDPRGFIQDDETADKYLAGRIRLDLSLILDHDPFKYRVGDLFIYFGGGRYDYDVDAIDIQNKRRLDEKLWWAVWAAGVRYDMGASLRFSLTAAQRWPMNFMNYDYIYWDERGELYSTGSGSGASTEIFVSIEGAF